MAWTVQYSKIAEKQLRKLPHETEVRIRGFMEQRVAAQVAPRVLAKKLSGAYEDRLRYRVGDYRVICRFYDHRLLILVLRWPIAERFIASAT